jgi:hypothetical protein
METINFGKATLDIVKKKLHLKQIETSTVLDTWFERSKTVEITEIEDFMIRKFQKMMLRRIREWNEFELSEHFLGPIMAWIDFNTDYFSMFAERIIEIQTDKLILTGKADMIIAGGDTEPEHPYLCLQEYKRQTDPNGDPLYQVISEMYAASQKNNNSMPVYGISITGKIWQFVVLQNSEYYISYSFSADSIQIFEIYKILKALKDILIENAIRQENYSIQQAI